MILSRQLNRINSVYLQQMWIEELLVEINTLELAVRERIDKREVNQPVAAD